MASSTGASKKQKSSTRQAAQSSKPFDATRVLNLVEAKALECRLQYAWGAQPLFDLIKELKNE